ncbi:MAG: hypothetical protein R2844_05545 [Caldilineales bacterium]
MAHCRSPSQRCADARRGGGVRRGRGEWQLVHQQHAAAALRRDAEGEQPARLFLKMVATDLGDGEFFGPSEVDYYTRDYVDVPDAPLLRCYDGCYSPVSSAITCCWRTLSSTHVTALEKVPTLAYGLALAEGLAALHALVGRAWAGGGRRTGPRHGLYPPLRRGRRAGRGQHRRALPRPILSRTGRN